MIEYALTSQEKGATLLDQMKDLAKRCEGIEYTLVKAKEYRDISKEDLRSLKKSELRNSLSLLVDYVANRRY